VTGSWI